MKTVDPNLPSQPSGLSACLWAWLPLLAGLGLPVAAADDGARLAMDHGCLNCHWSQSHSAPTMSHLAGKMARKGDQPATLQHVLDEMRHEGNIHGHRMVSDESALAILKWLAQGGK